MIFLLMSKIAAKFDPILKVAQSGSAGFKFQSMLDLQTFSKFANYTVGFWCQTIHKKILRRFDTSFDFKMMMKIYAIENIFKSHEPFQSYLLKVTP